MGRVKYEHDEKLQKAYEITSRLFELHDRGPIGVVEAHRLMRDHMQLSQCPVCMERLPRFEVIHGSGVTGAVGAPERADSDSAREPES